MDGYNYLSTKSHTIAILAFNAHDITMDVLKRTYKNGELAGPYEEYDEKGYLLKKGDYINGVRTPLERL